MNAQTLEIDELRQENDALKQGYLTMKRWVYFWQLTVAGVVIYFLAVIWLYTAPPTIPDVRALYPVAEREQAWAAKRMAFHGVTSCYRDESGWWFVRDGERMGL